MPPWIFLPNRLYPPFGDIHVYIWYIYILHIQNIRYRETEAQQTPVVCRSHGQTHLSSLGGLTKKGLDFGRGFARAPPEFWKGRLCSNIRGYKWYMIVVSSVYFGVQVMFFGRHCKPCTLKCDVMKWMCFKKRGGTQFTQIHWKKRPRCFSFPSTSHLVPKITSPIRRYCPNHSCWASPHDFLVAWLVGNHPRHPPRRSRTNLPNWWTFSRW